MADRPGPKYRRIADDLRAAIASGEIPVGGRVPTRAHLMTDYGVALNTVDRALVDLRREGLIQTDQGAGTVVLRTPAEPGQSPEFLELMAGLESLAGRMTAIEKRLGLDGDDGASGP